MTVRGEMEYAYQGELVTPSRCGRMDQACAFGSKPVVMTYDSEFIDVTTIRVPRPLHLVLVDLCAKKDTVEILSKLQACFPFAKNEDERNVQSLLGPINRDIMARAVAAIEAGAVEEVGKLMTEAQGYFDRYAGKVCPSQLTAPVLHKVLNHAALAPHVFGGKGVGAGGDGTAQFLCRSEEAQRAVSDILQRDFGMPSLFLTVAASSPVTKAVIPAAGFGTAVFPASRCTKPELFPVIDADGVCKPVSRRHEGGEGGARLARQWFMLFPAPACHRCPGARAGHPVERGGVRERGPGGGGDRGAARGRAPVH
jgi:hypothetical protein